MGNFRWDGGAKRKLLDDSLPTDSAVNCSQINFRFKTKFDLFMVIGTGGDARISNLFG